MRQRFPIVASIKTHCPENHLSTPMTDQEIISSLIAHDPKVTAQFFIKDCRPLSLASSGECSERRLLIMTR